MPTGSFAIWEPNIRTAAPKIVLRQVFFGDKTSTMNRAGYIIGNLA